MRKARMGAAIVLLSFILVILLGLFSYAGSAETPATKKFDWKFWGAGAITSPEIAPLRSTFDNIYKMRNGRLKITIYVAEELPYKQTEEVTMVRDRKVEMCGLWPSHVEGNRDFFGVESMVGIGRDMGHLVRIMQEVKRPWLNGQLQKTFGTTILTSTQWPTWYIWSTKPIRSLADLKGLKIRGLGSTINALYLELGAVPVDVAFSEVQSALQYGLLQAAGTGSPYAISQGWLEIAKNGYLMPIRSPAEYVTVNSAALAELPADIRDIFNREMAAVDKTLQNEANTLEKDSLAKAEKMGVKMVRPSAEDQARFEKICAKVNRQWLADPKRSALAKEFGEAVLQAAYK